MAGILKVDKYQDFNGNDIMTSDGAGSITLSSNMTTAVQAAGATNTPAFHCGQSSSQTISNSTATKITLDATETLDTDNAFASSRFTPQTAGYYYIYGSVRYNSATDWDNVYLDIMFNGSNRILNNSGPNFHYNTFKVAGIVNFNGSSDYVELFTSQYSGSDKSTRNGDGTTGNQTYFGGYKIIE